MALLYNHDWKIEMPVEEVRGQARKKAAYHAERAAFWRKQEEQHKDGDNGGDFANAQTYVSKVKEHDGLARDLTMLVRFLERLPAEETLKVTLTTFEELGF